MEWGERIDVFSGSKHESSAANFLTNAAYDPDSGIPEYKVCAVRLETIEEG